MSPPTYDDSGVTLKELLDALRDNNRSSQEDRKQLQLKMDDLSRNVQDIRREQQLAIENLRRDFERLFVPRTEYDPKHEVILDKIKQYDLILDRSRTNQDEVVRYRAKVDEVMTDYINLKNDFDTYKREEKGRRESTPARITPWIGIAISIASLALVYAQHIVIR